MKLSKTAYLHTFTFIVLILGVIKWFNIGGLYKGSETATNDSISAEETVAETVLNEDIEVNLPQRPEKSKDGAATDNRIPHRIFSVYRFDKAFPDSNNVQILSAQKWGVSPVESNEDAEKRKNELVYVGASPWYHVDRLKQSAPYLVPRAAVLLQDIGRAFLDSLDIKGIPLHKIIATSVLRTKESVAKLRQRNHNATENSCHLYGTTFDICYNRYETVQDPNGPKRRQVTNDTLKWVLSEVLRDMRETGRCHVKYEVKQGCFHITTR